MTAPTLLDVQDVKKYLPVRKLIGTKGNVKAVDGVSFSVEEGTTFGLVGESGCGKTTLAKLVLMLEPWTSGEIRFSGINLSELKGSDQRRFRSSVQAVFQDPYSSLSPRQRVRDIVSEPVVANKLLQGSEVQERTSEVLRMVGLSASAPERYPHEFSGGQRQRIAIARALAVRPRLMVLDEPVSALDVSIRAQILNLLADLQATLGLSYLLIAHDLAVVEHMAQTIGVMYLGRMVEQAPAKELYRNALHPYTQALLSAVPVPDPTARNQEYTALAGEIPSAMRVPPGCRFHPRCPHSTDTCRTEDPEFREITPGHYAACHYAEKFVNS